MTNVPLKRLIDARRPLTYGIVQAGPHDPDGVPYIRPVDMTAASGVVDQAALLRTSPTIATAYARARVAAGDIVLSIGPSYGKVMVVPPELAGANLTQGTARLAPAGGVDASWLYWALQSTLATSFWDAAVAGGTFRALNLGPLGETPLPYTPLAEQRRIAAFLDDQVSRLDRAVALRREQGSLLREHYHSYVHEALSRSRERTLPLRRLLAEAVVGIVVQPASLYTDADGVPALRGLDVRERTIRRDGHVALTAAGHAANPRSHLRRGDVVVVRTGDAGAAALVPEWAVGWNCIDLLVVRAGPTARPAYLELVINAAKASGQLGNAASGALHQHFGVGALCDLTVPALNLAEQQSVCLDVDAAWAALEEARSLLAQSVHVLLKYKQSLVTAAVTGAIDVTTASGRRIPA